MTRVLRPFLLILLSLGPILCALVAGANATERVTYYHNDHLGTPQLMTDEAGTVVWQAEYRPFGEVVLDEDADGDGKVVRNNVRFPGQYYDVETGLNYNWHRYYEPETGRYLQADPFLAYPNLISFALARLSEEPSFLQPYAYAANNPIRFEDPNGWLPRKRQCDTCDPAERTAMKSRLGVVCGRLASGNFTGNEKDSLGQTNCYPWGVGFTVLQSIASNCVYNCVWEHEYRHYSDCLKLNRLSRRNSKIQERPGWETEKSCLQGYLGN